MRKMFVVLFSLFLVFTYSTFKYVFVNVLGRAETFRTTVGNQQPYKGNDIFEQIPILNLHVGEYTPPKTTDPARRVILDQVLADNAAAVIPQGNFGPRENTATRAAEMNRPRPAQRLGDVITDAFTVNNSGINLKQWIERKMAHEVDPTWDMGQHMELLEGLPSTQWGRFHGTRSYAEALDLRNAMKDHLAAEGRLNDAGIAGFWARLLAGVLDIDTIAVVVLAWYGLSRLRARVSAIRERWRTS